MANGLFLPLTVKPTKANYLRLSRKQFDHSKAYFMELYIMKSDGSGLRRLTNTPGYDGGPFFSADGKKICWRRFSEDHATAEIYTMNIDGTDEKKLTNMKKLSWAPYFHPSAQYLIYATNQHGFANFELYIVRADGKGQPTRVTYKEGFDGLPCFTLTEKNSHGHQSVPRMAPLRFLFQSGIMQPRARHWV